jgi:hypothetical protein
MQSLNFNINIFYKSFFIFFVYEPIPLIELQWQVYNELAELLRSTVYHFSSFIDYTCQPQTLQSFTNTSTIELFLINTFPKQPSSFSTAVRAKKPLTGFRTPIN